MEDSIQTFRVGPCRFGISTSAGSDWRIEELLPSLAPFLLSAQADEENEPPVAFTLAVEPDGAPTDTDKEDLKEFRRLVEFEWEGATCRISVLPHTGRHLITLLAPNDPKEYLAISDFDFAIGTLFLHQSAADAFALNNILMMYYAFATACADTVLMHASVVRKDGKGYLFLGKSGTGKSTHTRLWLQNIPACELLNDDNPIVSINKDTGRATVFGSPWSGKTPCYKNESIPVGAFVRLEQAPQNEIRREGAARAFASLLPSCSSLKEAEELNNGVIETVKFLAAHTPVYHLKCLPNPAAAELCFNTLKQ